MALSFDHAPPVVIDRPYEPFGFDDDRCDCTLSFADTLLVEWMGALSLTALDADAAVVVAHRARRRIIPDNDFSTDLTSRQDTP